MRIIKKTLSIILVMIMLVVATLPNVMATTDDKIEAENQLAVMIREAEDAIADGNNFINETRQSVWDEINRAYELLEDENSTIEEILAQIQALKNAIDGLVVPELELDELWQVILESEYFIKREGRYEEVSYSEFNGAGLQAKVAYYYGQSQEEVDNAVTALRTAMNNLIKIYQGIIGDVNSDNEVNISDVTEIQKNLVKLSAFDKMQKISADYNDDLTINIKDATKIQMHLVGLM